MVRQAESLNANPRCRYLVHAEPPLPFPGERFAFIYSNIVLQHVPQRISAKYLREFIRILAPGGVIVFGVQDCFRAPDLSSRFERIRQILRISSRVRAFLKSGAGGMQMHCFPECTVRRILASAGIETRIVDIQFTNIGTKDFNGKLVYLSQPPASGYLGKQYCIAKSASSLAAGHRS
jgi:SAM-dependent methyltransferase